MKKGVIAGLSMVLGASIGGAVTGSIQNKKNAEYVEKANKMGEFYDLLVQWLKIKQEGKSLVSYFKQNGYETVAIYGMKELGERLCDELDNSEVKVMYAIDKNADAIYSDVDVFTPDDTLEKVDVIVVTAIRYFEQIEANLQQKVDCPIVSLEDIIYEL